VADEPLQLPLTTDVQNTKKRVGAEDVVYAPGETGFAIETSPPPPER
jgi:hypothetical protein